jgi:hypothetical protein
MSAAAPPRRGGLCEFERREGGDGRQWTRPLFLRRTIPYLRDLSDKPPAEQVAAFPFLRHLGIYGYRREALLRLVTFPAPRSRSRRSWNNSGRSRTGIAIAVVRVEYESIGVDAPMDVARVEAILARGPAAPETCPNCGADVPRGARSCPGCGAVNRPVGPRMPTSTAWASPIGRLRPRGIRAERVRRRRAILAPPGVVVVAVLVLVTLVAWWFF